MATSTFFAAVLLAQPPSEIRVSVDPRLEVMSVVQVLAGYEWTGLLAKDDTPYRRDVNIWFAPFKQHPAVTTFDKLSHQGYNFDGPASTMVCLTPPPELKLTAPAADCGASRAGGEKQLEAWLAELRDFVRTSDFLAFFRAHAGFYQLMTEQTQAKLKANYAANLEAYHGIRQRSYNIVLTPLLNGNYGPRVQHADGDDVFGILGVVNPRGPVPQFGEVESLRSLVWHEFGHSFVNPVVDAHKTKISASAKLMEPIESRMKAQAYPQWHTSVIEHVDRAIEVRITARELGEAEGGRALLTNRVRGFAYLPALVERLKEYDADRVRYPKFADFAPRLFAVFDELAARDLGRDFHLIPFDLTMNGVHSGGGPAVYIYPTAEPDKNAEAKILEYAKTIRDRFSPKSRLLSDEEALKSDLGDAPVMAYGTLDGNLWLARHKAHLPIRIEPGKVVADKEYTGEHLRVIACMTLPGSPQTGIAIYTAAKPEDVPGLNGIFHGPSGWQVMDGTNILKSGNYKRQGERLVIE